MPRHWTEPYDPAVHRLPWWPRDDDTLDRLQREQRVVYRVSVAGFDFVFRDLEELAEYAAFFATKTHPSSRAPVEGDHWETQSKFDRLPQRLLDGHRRPAVRKALAEALAHFRRDP